MLKEHLRFISFTIYDFNVCILNRHSFMIYWLAVYFEYTIIQIKWNERYKYLWKKNNQWFFQMFFKTTVSYCSIKIIKILMILNYTY